MLILRGLPGSGKSFTARTILESVTQRGMTCNIRSTDSFFIKNGIYTFVPLRLREYHITNQIKVRDDCDYGVNIIIVDNTNTTWKEMAPYIQYAKDYSYEVYVQEPNTDWAFDVDKCAANNTHGVPKESIQKMLDRWEDTETIRKKTEEFMKT